MVNLLLLVCALYNVKNIPLPYTVTLFWGVLQSYYKFVKLVQCFLKSVEWLLLHML